MAPPTRNRLQRQPQPQSYGLSIIQWIFMISVLGGSIFMGLHYAQNYGDIFEERPTEEQPKAREYKFDPVLFQLQKKELIEMAENEKKIFEKYPVLQTVKNTLLDHKEIMDVPENFYTKWVPDPTRFEGVTEFVEKTKAKGTIMEEYFWLEAPIFTKVDENRVLTKFATDTQHLLHTLEISGCNYLPDSECHQTELKMVKGDLYMTETLTGRNEEITFTRVFYIPAEEINKL